MSEKLGTIVMKRYGTNTEQGELCEIVSIINQPTFELKTVDGHVFTWVQSITRPASEEETVRYWRERALKAEQERGERVASQKDAPTSQV